MKCLFVLMILMPAMALSQEWRFTTFNHLDGASNGDGVVIVVGSHGGMLRSTDGGRRWDHPETGNYRHQYAALFLDESRVIVGADSGRLLLSDDAGSTWRLQALPTTRGIVGLSRRSTDEIVAYTRSELFRSRNRGDDWEPLIGYPSDLFRLVYTEPNIGVILTGDGAIHRSTDSGDTWQVVLPADTAAGLRALAFHPNGLLGLAGGTGTTLRLTTDGGASWRFLDGPDRDLDIRAIAIDSSGRIAIGGMARRAYGGAFYTSIDTAQQWIRIDPKPAVNLLILNAFISAGDESFALFNQGAIYRSDDHWVTFDTITNSDHWSPTSGRLLSASPPEFIDSLGLIPASILFGSYLRTEDRGATWRKAGLAGNKLFGFELFPDGWGLVFRSPQVNETFGTTDSGWTWKRIGTMTEPFLGNVHHVRSHFFSQREGVIAVYLGLSENQAVYLMRTEDSARTFVGEKMPDYHAFQDLYFSNRDTGLLTGVQTLFDSTGRPLSERRELISLTEDGGRTWRLIYDRISNWASPSCAVIPRPGTIVACVSGDAFGHAQMTSLIKSDDLGRTWREVLTLDDLEFDQILDLAAFTDRLLFAVGRNGLVLRSDDGGDTWAQEPVSRWGVDTFYTSTAMTSGFRIPFDYFHVRLLDDGRTGLITGSSGMLRIVFPDSLVSGARIEGNRDDAMRSLDLSIAPNPATSSMRLKLKGEWSGEAAVVRMFDLTGRLVLLTRWMRGVSLEVDLSGVPSGRYRLFVDDMTGESIARSEVIVVR